VIGAGSSGLAVLKALREEGLRAECFERGSDVGGLWRYENDNRLSSAYASLRTNVSRPRMQYPGFPMPATYGDFPDHTQMWTYLSAYADAYGLRESIRFRVTVERVEPKANGTWRVLLDDGSVRDFRAVVVAVGIFWCPKIPRHEGSFSGETSHSHDYRKPDTFAGRSVPVVGAGQSAAEIVSEVANVTARAFMSVRSAAHVIPRWIGGGPYDAFDIDPLNRSPWPLMNGMYAFRVARQLGPLPRSWPVPGHRLLEGVPTLSSDLFPAIRQGKVTVKPAIERLAGHQVCFVDGTRESIDHIIWATGYEISLPFLSSNIVSPRGREFPLYRRIVPPGLAGLFFSGFVDAPGGLLPVVETQAGWIAAVLVGRPSLPPLEQMWAAIDRSERRTRVRFPEEAASSVRCDPHAYRRLLRSDLRRARWRLCRRRDAGPLQGERSEPSPTW